MQCDVCGPDMTVGFRDRQKFTIALAIQPDFQDVQRVKPNASIGCGEQKGNRICVQDTSRGLVVYHSRECLGFVCAVALKSESLLSLVVNSLSSGYHGKFLQAHD
jgi:hypothetical protein